MIRSVQFNEVASQVLLIAARLMILALALSLVGTSACEFFYENQPGALDTLKESTAQTLLWSLLAILSISLLTQIVALARHRALAAEHDRAPAIINRQAADKADDRFAEPWIDGVSWRSALDSWVVAKTRALKRGPERWSRTVAFYMVFLGAALLIVVLVIPSTAGSRDQLFIPILTTVWLLPLALDILLLFALAIFLPWPADARPADATDETRVQDNICLLIACHNSCLTDEKANRFRNVLRHALKRFPASSIFVCDNNASLTPTDNTEIVCQQMSPEIHYQYIPEGNKTVSYYWTLNHWMPSLERRGAIRSYDFVMIIDDDVLLPRDLTIDSVIFDEDPKVRALAYPLKAVQSAHKPTFWESMFRVEFVLDGFSMLFQSCSGSALFAHGPIALWRRDSLVDVLYRHDTIFHGEDMNNAFQLYELRKNWCIKMIPQIVPTYAPNNFVDLFSQRVKSWDVATFRLSWQMLSELTTHWQSRTLAIKPFLLARLVNNLSDWFRIPFLVGGLIAVPVYVAKIMLALTGGYLATMIIFNLVALRHRRDLRVSAGDVLLYALYRQLLQVFRWCALLHCAVSYIPLTPRPARICEREESIRDLPPVPKWSQPDWHTVYSATGASRNWDV